MPCSLCHNHAQVADYENLILTAGTAPECALIFDRAFARAADANDIGSRSFVLVPRGSGLTAALVSQGQQEVGRECDCSAYADPEPAAEPEAEGSEGGPEGRRGPGQQPGEAAAAEAATRRGAATRAAAPPELRKSEPPESPDMGPPEP